MRNQFPDVQFIPGPTGDTTMDLDYRGMTPWYKSKRVIVFLTTFLTTLLVGESYNFLRPAVYRSSATLLTVAKPHIDQSSGEADIQHVSIQRHILTGTPLLTETARRLRQTDAIQSADPVMVNDIRNMLVVTPVEDTNLVELQAEGHDPNILHLLVNTWIDVYLDARAQEVQKSTDDTTSALTEEYRGLKKKIETKQEQLKSFRKQYDIVSMEREENEVLSRLRGLNASLNKTNEASVTAKARLNAIKQAIADGKPVVPDREKQSLAGLEQRAQLLQERATEASKQYTPNYIKLQPALRAIPEQLRNLEKKIQVKLDSGKKFMLSEAEQDYSSAIQSLNAIHQQLNDLKKEASEFSSNFAEHEALVEELSGLELIYRQTKERLARLEVKRNEKYPQVDVVEWAFRPEQPIRPHYFRDAGIVLVASLLLGIFAVWLYEYLTRQVKTASGITLSGIHVYGNSGAQQLENNLITAQLEQQSTQALPNPFPRELSKHEIKVLLANADIKGRQLIFFLLIGLTVDEAANLSKEDFNMENSEFNISGRNSRTIPFGPSVRALIVDSGELPAWHSSTATEDIAALAALITCIAIDSGLPQPEQIDVHSLRHSYILYLVRQGLKLSELVELVGPMPTPTLAAYGQFSPPGPGLFIKDIKRDHPVCQE